MSVCAGYANLFLSLAEARRLEAVVSGYAKGIGYGLGQTTFTQPNHAWNAVRIDGQWRLLAATWGAGYLSPSSAFERAFNAHYFLTRPELFIYDHLPEDPRWQLLDTHISMFNWRFRTRRKSPSLTRGACCRCIGRKTFSPDRSLSRQETFRLGSAFRTPAHPARLCLLIRRIEMPFYSEGETNDCHNRDARRGASKRGAE